MRLLSPNPDSVVWPAPQIFIPYTKAYPATLISLLGFNYQPVKTDGEYGYSDFFKQRWSEGKTFINVEQDIVIWPGAIKSIWECPHPWCGYDFHLPNHQIRNLEEELVGVPIGCVKISAEAISKTPEIWDKPIEWSMCEQNLTKALIHGGIKFHQHRPGIVNANEVFLDFIKGIEY